MDVRPIGVSSVVGLLLFVAVLVGAQYAQAIESVDRAILSGQTVLDSFKIVQTASGVLLRYSNKRHTTRVRLEMDPSRPSELVVPVSHLHLNGICEGFLRIGAEGVRFVPDSGDHGFTVIRNLRYNANYALGPTIEITPPGRHKLRFQVACVIRQTVDTTGPMNTCGFPQTPVMVLTREALQDFPATSAAILAAAELP